MRAGPLILDLDGVLRRWDPAIIAEAEVGAGLPAGELARAAFADADLLLAAVTGAMPDEEWRRTIAHRLDARHPGSGAAAVEAWSVSPGEVDRDVLQVVREQRRIRPVALLTNATTRLPLDLAALGLDREVDAVFNTAGLRVAKPDPAVFRLVAERLGVRPSACAFVDDTAANVEAARRVGMRAHHFLGVAALRSWLGGSGA